jgi:hypothetical protein
LTDEGRPGDRDETGGAPRAPALEFEPLPPQSGTVVARPMSPAAARAVERAASTAAARRAKPAAVRVTTDVAWSLALHAGLLFLLLVLLPRRQRGPEEPEPAFRIALKDWHWVGDDPQADGSGPRGPVPDAAARPPEGTAQDPGFADDDLYGKGSIGAAGRGAPAGSLFAGRVEGKEGLLAAGGGDGRSEGAVRLALEWLARHQRGDGTWTASGFARSCAGPGCTGEGEDEYRTAATALALLPFLGAGHTWRAGPWKDTVRRGVRALVDLQRPDGRFAPQRKRGYGDALATLALAEAYGLTRAASLRAPVERAVASWVRTQSPAGGWRYEPGDGEADSSVTGWVALALVAASRADATVPGETLRRCREWFEDRTDALGRVGYTGTSSFPKALLGVGHFVPLLLGEAPGSPRLASVAAQLECALPRWPDDPAHPRGNFGTDDPMHWYYGALAAHQSGGATWRAWNERMRDVVLSHQERGGCSAGSWPPCGSTGVSGGRVVTTALCALTLEVYYRYPRVATAR